MKLFLIGGERHSFCDLSKIVRFSLTGLSIRSWSPSLVVLFLFHVIYVESRDHIFFQCSFRRIGREVLGRCMVADSHVVWEDALAGVGNQGIKR